MLFLRFSLFFIFFVKVNTSDVQEQPNSNPQKQVNLDQETIQKLLKSVFATAGGFREYVKEQEQQSGQADLPKQAPAMYSRQNLQNLYENSLQQMPHTYFSQQTTNAVPPSVFRQPVQEISGRIYEDSSEEVPQTKQKLSVKEFPTNAQQILLQNRSQKRTPSSVYQNAPVEEKRLPPELPSSYQTQNVQPSTNQDISEQIQQQIQKFLQNFQKKPETELTQNPSQYTPKQEYYQETYRKPEAKGVENILDNFSNRKQIMPQNFYQRPYLQRSGQDNIARPELNYFPPAAIPYGVTNPLAPYGIPRASETPEDQTEKVTRHVQAGGIRVVQVTPDTP